MEPVAGDSPLIDGRYRLGAELGRGGSAVVRMARDERLGRDVAVKLFHPGSADPRREQAEIALSATLAHPSLVRLYDGGTSVDTNGTDFVYLVMEYVAGPTLRRAVDRGPLPLAQAGAVGAELAAALAYLHAREIIHRDVKPANVLLPLDGAAAAKLSDFGVARMLDGTRVTATGMTVGTANYLSPEQVRGHALGPASDVYALGLVLLETVTGRIVYDGVGIAAAVSRLDRSPDVPPALDPVWHSLLTAMLALDPAARPDASEVQRVLAAWATTAGAPADDAVARRTDLLAGVPASHTAVLAAPPRRRRVRPLLAAGAGAAAIAAIVIGVVSAGDGPGRPGGSTRSPSAPAVAQTPSRTPTPTGSPTRSATPAATRPVVAESSTTARSSSHQARSSHAHTKHASNPEAPGSAAAPGHGSGGKGPGGNDPGGNPPGQGGPGGGPGAGPGKGPGQR